MTESDDNTETDAHADFETVQRHLTQWWARYGGEIEKLLSEQKNRPGDDGR